jgi:hypothetical protein
MHFVGYYCMCIRKSWFEKQWLQLYTFFELIARRFGWSTPRLGRFNPGKVPKTVVRRLFARVPGLDEWGISRSIGFRSSYRPSRSKSLHRLPKEGDLATVSCFVAGTDWYRAVGANIRFVVLCFRLFVTTNLRAVVLWEDLNGVMPVVAGYSLSAVIWLLRYRFVWLLYHP